MSHDLRCLVEISFFELECDYLMHTKMSMNMNLGDRAALNPLHSSSEEHELLKMAPAINQMESFMAHKCDTYNTNYFYGTKI